MTLEEEIEEFNRAESVKVSAMSYDQGIVVHGSVDWEVSYDEVEGRIKVVRRLR